MKKLAFLFNAFLAFCLSLIGYSCNNTENRPVCMYGGPAMIEQDEINDSTIAAQSDSLTAETDTISSSEQ